MIKFSMNGEISISGALPQIVVELEYILRSVRTAFCDVLGKKDGNLLLEECIKNSKLSVQERAKRGEEELERKREEDPEGAASIETEIDKLMETILERLGNKMAFYNKCSVCGAHLDPGETCDCQREKKVVYVGICSEAGTVVEEEQAYDYALERCLKGTSQDQEDFKEMLVEWFYSGNFVKEEVAV
ncbi:MAG: hypothetical protein U0L05_01235 [Schaedlerella sp.]|nr:hypothetical protein [Schaedlerella sp.]